MKLRRKVTVGGVSMFVVAGAISRSGRAGNMKLVSTGRRRRVLPFPHSRRPSMACSEGKGNSLNLVFTVAF
jgi:hypothetical protein